MPFSILQKEGEREVGIQREIRKNLVKTEQYSLTSVS